MRIYLAGPMRGRPGWNFPLFDAVAARLRSRGHLVLSPAESARLASYGPESEAKAYPDSPEGRAHLRHVILKDIADLFSVEAVVLLPGWESSRGARVEYALAEFLGLKLFTVTPSTDSENDDGEFLLPEGL